MHSSETQGNEQRTPHPSASYLRHRLADLIRKIGGAGHENQGQLSKTYGAHSMLDSLEAYKEAVDSTIEWQADLGATACTHESACDGFSLDPLELANGDEAEHTPAHWIPNESFEWQDPATGAWMGYAACADEDEDDCNVASAMNAESEGCSMDSKGATGVSPQVGHRDAVASAIMRDLCEEGAENDAESNGEEDDEGSDRESDIGSMAQTSSESRTSHADESLSHSDDDGDEASTMDDQHQYTEWYGDVMWKDQESGTILAYEICDDEREEEAVQLGIISHSSATDRLDRPLQIAMEWKDESTGIMMGYALDDV
eukprot:TRINITY_DN23387_c0_g1_i1.p1 TRINITY_DN23387_c0_g1~~TRINITY_DN23387_c0_g1_i1.p1  ORF type:complete len:315 (-),score=67.30 TRINITY_DN23387_c0_g1_i1:418-1362(-)